MTAWMVVIQSSSCWQTCCPLWKMSHCVYVQLSSPHDPTSNVLTWFLSDSLSVYFVPVRKKTPNSSRLQTFSVYSSCCWFCAINQGKLWLKSQILTIMWGSKIEHGCKRQVNVWNFSHCTDLSVVWCYLHVKGPYVCAAAKCSLLTGLADN